VSHVVVVRPGMLTTVQDNGRWGYQARGVPVAGPMDSVSHRMANALVGNAVGAATLEITLLGPELEFEDDRLVAVGGADFDLTVDGQPAPMRRPVTVRAGGRLRFGARRRGARAYVAIAGGIAVVPVLGSRATHLISGMGGVDGRALRAGDRLPLGVSAGSGPSGRAMDGRAPGRRPGESFGDPAPVVPASSEPVAIRVLPGPQPEYFTPDALDALQSAPYTIGARSDRMAYRLEGPRLSHDSVRGADIISDATPLGVLQVPASGLPILLMADRQTTGGYPKLATVIAADISAAGQLGPGDRLRFVTCTRAEAMAALIAQERALMALEARP
jgi:antagonist of KipI